jgi:transcriptional regulator with XRE-family HTH domain
MKQPELGRKITELRKEKGLTQEELVDKCNISVRTLQRIETGEVMPRVYTVKTILAALDYDLSKISDDEDDFMDKVGRWLKSVIYIDLDLNRPSDYLVTQLNIAWIFGLIYFILGFLEAPADYFREKDSQMIFSNTFYVILKISILISYLIFQRGFILVGFLFKNYLLKIISVILMLGMFFVIGYDIISLFYNSMERSYILGAEALTFGGIGLIYGVSLLRLRKSIGLVANFAGIFELIAACFFLTIILAFVGLILSIPKELFEIVILYKSMEIIKFKQQETTIP